MRTSAFVGAILTLFALLAPAAAAEPPAPIPAAHEELARTLDELVGQLHDLGSRWREHFLPREPRSERPLITFMLRHREGLGLSREQIEKLERLRADFQREAIRREADLRVAELELAALMDAEPADLGQVEAKLREIERARADLRLARIRTVEQAKAQLTQEQRAKLRSLLADSPSSRFRTGESHPPRGERLY